MLVIHGERDYRVPLRRRSPSTISIRPSGSIPAWSSSDENAGLEAQKLARLES
jgi:hypothetical protein